MNATTAKRYSNLSDPIPPDTTFDSVETALGEVKRLILWLEYIAESQYTAAERQRLITISRRFATAAQPIANKYLD